MCTLAFEYQKERLTIGFNRDEITERNLAYSPQCIQKNDIKILAPIDPVGSGTWIGINQYGRVACLMNHTHYKQQYNLNYLHSRGQLVLDILSLVYEQPFFYVQAHAAYFAPFHLFVFDTENAFRVTWNGFELHFYSLFYGSYSFSSATLYSLQTSVQRDMQWKKINKKEQKEYEDFLTTCRIQKKVNPLGKEVATVSFTWLTRHSKKGIIEYQMLYPEIGNKTISQLILAE
jgi:uncharacterized protein with NRDE domain